MFAKCQVVCFSFFVFLTAGKAEERSTSGYQPPKSQEEVAVTKFDWNDAGRKRDVPVKVYYPKATTTASPVIVFSHGLGGSREGYTYLGEHWAGCGFVSVHVQHVGSDDTVWKDLPRENRRAAMQKAAATLTNALDRPLDVSFVITKLTEEQKNKESPLAGRLDLERIGASGHSFGGFTTMAVSGQSFLLGGDRFREPRIKAAIEMSSPVPDKRQLPTAYAKVTIPVMHMTGTRDDSPFGDAKAADRRLIFDNMPRSETCLIIFKEGDHMIFSGSRLTGNTEHDVEFHRLICDTTTAFWQAYLNQDQKSKQWLLEGGCEKLLGKEATFETHSPQN